MKTKELKYVIVKNMKLDTDREKAIVFDCDLVHCFIYPNTKDNPDNSTKIVSAGFCKLTYDDRFENGLIVETYGKSKSLGIKSRKIDANIIYMSMISGLWDYSIGLNMSSNSNNNDNNDIISQIKLSSEKLEDLKKMSEDLKKLETELINQLKIPKEFLDPNNSEKKLNKNMLNDSENVDKVAPTDLLSKTNALIHMTNGGQVFRVSETKKRRDRFFYKIEDGKLMCRVNECGGWHPSFAPLRDTDKLHVATVDWKTEGLGSDMRTVEVPLPLPD